VKPEALSGFANHTLQAARDAARLKTVRASRVKGRPFQFLHKIWDLDQAPWTETDKGETLLIFRAPTLEQAAPKLFEQESLFSEDRLQPDWTVFDLLGQVVFEVQRSPSQDLRMDFGMLKSVHAYNASVKKGLDAATFEFRSDRKGTALINAPLIQKATDALLRTPEPRRIRIVGKLNMLRMSDRLFELNLSDGTRLRGIWTPDAVSLRELLGEDVLMEGEAAFRVNGDVLSLQAAAARVASEADAGFKRRPIVSSADVRLKLLSTGNGAFQSIVGKWPGEESDAEIEELLAAIS
jgi:hypothetical protein